MDKIEPLSRVLDSQREGTHIKYQAMILPTLDALCPGSATSRQQHMEHLDLTEDGVQTILSNVTMAIQREGSVWPLAKGGWYQSEPGEYRVKRDFTHAWLAYRGKTQP